MPNTPTMSQEDQSQKSLNEAKTEKDFKDLGALTESAFLRAFEELDKDSKDGD